MEKYSCIIVEDEPLATEVLQRYISDVAFLELKETCGDAVRAAEVLNNLKIDLIFLDIHLPKLKGLDFLKTLKNPPAVIVTTAYRDYAVLGFELNVIDYLVKPIEFSRFLTAVNKLSKTRDVVVSSGAFMHKAERPHLYFSVSKKKVKVFLDEILYIESLKEYIRINTKTKSILTKFAIGQIEGMLEKNEFIRIHKSFIVSKDKIEAYNSTELEINGKQLPIGRSYKEFVMSALD